MDAKTNITWREVSFDEFVDAAAGTSREIRQGHHTAATYSYKVDPAQPIAKSYWDNVDARHVYMVRES